MTISKARIKTLAGLARAEERAATKQMLLEGRHLVAEGLDRGVVREIFVAPSFSDVAGVRAAAGAIPVTEVSAADIQRLVDVKTPDGVAALADWNGPRTPSDILRDHSRIVYLEAVQDPGNVGTIARTSAALGAGALLLSPGTADPTAPKTLRSSAGALLWLPYAQSLDVEALFTATASTGHTVLVLDPHEGVLFGDLVAPPKWVLVASNEGGGTRVSPNDGRCTRVRIPLESGFESLNVAAAVAILLAHLRDAAG